MWITPTRKQSNTPWPPPLEIKIEIFYERTLHWQLHIADLLANGGQPLGESFSVPRLLHSGFAVLQICLSYFETIGQYEQRGTNTSTVYFKEGVKSVFPQLRGKQVEELLTKLYKGARCGLYHNSMPTPGVGLGQPSDGTPIAFDPIVNLLAISPERLTAALKNHLEEYHAKLLDPANADLRFNFEKRFDKHNGIKSTTRGQPARAPKS